METYYEKMKPYDTILLCGYTDDARELKKEIRLRFPEKTVIPVDNDIRKQKGSAGGVCISSEEAANYRLTGYYVVVPPNFMTDILNQLKMLGISEERICCGIPEEVFEAVKQQRGQRNLTKRRPEDFYFEINIVRHCNLNCKSCSHFSPLASEKYEDPEEYDRHLQRLSELFGGHVAHIILLGGEPLLHPQITEFMRIVRAYFPATELFILTNGLLLSQMEDSFWESCRQYRVDISVTRYPITLDYKRLEELVRSHGLLFRLFGGTDVGTKTLWHEPKDLTGGQDPLWEFTHCEQANVCYTLEGRRLYGCGTIPGIPAFNDFFGQKMEITEQDSIDIYQAESADEIMEFFAHPYPFCRYCDWKHKTWDHPWEKSDRRMEEWT